MISHHCLVRPESLEKNTIFLRNTMANLLNYLLAHAVDNIVTDQELMLNVWELNGLSASRPRLWQVMNALDKKLAVLGLQEKLIIRVPKKGYIVPADMVMCLYCKEESILYQEYCYVNKKTVCFTESVTT